MYVDSWQGIVMRHRWWQHAWLQQFGVAVGYALLYVAIHPLSTAHWPIHAGIRLACLLLMPYRFWPALYLGEAVSNAYEILPCENLGTAFIIARCVPPFTAVMPIVWWCRSRMPPILYKPARMVDIKALLVCILLVSLGNMAYSGVGTSLANTVHGVFDALARVPLFFFGPYVAILSVVPWMLMAWLDYRPSRWREQVRNVFASRLTLHMLLLLIPTIALLAWLSKTVGEHGQLSLIPLIAMVIPMAWLTMQYGWRAVAMSAPVVIACISLLFPVEDAVDDMSYAMMSTTTAMFLTVIVTALFILGARISTQIVGEEEEQLDRHHVRRIARQSLHLGEQRMRQTSQALEYLAGTAYISHSRWLEQMRRIMPNLESHAFYKQAMNMQDQLYRLAESLHPVAWRERGLPAALHETVARALDEAGMAYRCEITGRGFTRLAPTALTTAYRTACEAVVYVTSRLACTRVNLVLRGGETRGRRWLVLRVTGVLEDTGIADAIYYSEQRKRIAAKLGASAMDIPDLQTLVSIFDGQLHVRTFADKLQITMLLHDAPRSGEQALRQAPPFRLRVK